MKKTLSELETTFKNMDNDKGKVGLDLLVEVQFMKKTLERLRDEINKNDLVVEMQQGSYSIERSNPALNTYNTTITNYNKLIKQLTDLLPADSGKNKSDGFEEF